MQRRYCLAVLALGLAGSPLAAQQAAPPLAPHAAEWAAAALPDAPPALQLPAPAEAVRVQLDATRARPRLRPSFPIVTGLLAMVAGGAVGGTVMSRKCSENCGIRSFYGALGGSTLGFTVGFTLGRAAEGGDPTIPNNVPRPVDLGS